MNVLLWVMFIAGGFLSGSILFCKIIPKQLAHKDICEISDDSNPGAFNVFVHCGKGLGSLCLALDILKGFIPVVLASVFMDTRTFGFTLVMLAPVLGHALGIFNHFHGGKCIAVSFGVMLGILPVTWFGFAVLAGLYILFSTVFKIEQNRIRSIVVYALCMAVSCTLCSIYGLGSIAAGCGIIALTAIIKHLNFAALTHKETTYDEETT